MYQHPDTKKGLIAQQFLKLIVLNKCPRYEKAPIRGAYYTEPTMLI